MNGANTASETCGLNRPELDSPQAVTAVISSIQTVAEMLPGVVNASARSGGGSGDWIPWTSRGMLNRAVEMLRRYRNQLHKAYGQLEVERSEAREKDAIQHGIALGIEQEKRRVKEARRGRK